MNLKIKILRNKEVKKLKLQEFKVISNKVSLKEIPLLISVHLLMKIKKMKISNPKLKDLLLNLNSEVKLLLMI